MRIGEISRRTGVSVETLRAWERRYEVLDPDRSEGGHRLYGPQDVERVRQMQHLIDDGWSASAAAKEVRRQPSPVVQLRRIAGGDPALDLQQRLDAAFTDFDAAAADTVLDDVFARFETPAALDEVILPVVRHLGDGWQDDAGVIAREHFASNAIRPRLMRLLRVSLGRRDQILLAAAPEREEHDLGLLAAAVVAAHAGWSVHYLGYRTPTEALIRAAATGHPDVLLIGAVRRPAAERVLGELPEAIARAVVLGGAGFRPDDAVGHPTWRVHQGPMKALPVTLAEASAASA